jgi:hypothetical protein
MSGSHFRSRPPSRSATCRAQSSREATSP